MIGIDLVYIPRMKAMLEAEYGDSLLERMLSEDDGGHLSACGPDTKPEAVSELFAIKEAVIKASAGQLTINDLAQIRIEFIGHGQIFAHIPGREETFRVSTSVLGEYMMAVAVSDR